jgi:beta-mannosidase
MSVSTMPTLIDLSALDWTLTGWRPFAWKLRKSAETGGFLLPDHGPYPARLPGSVQENLRRDGAIPDWHVGHNSLAIEWVEHRQWMFTTTVTLPRDAGAVDFCAECLDYSGWVLLDGAVVGEFAGAQRPVRLALGAALAPGAHELSIVFDLPPEGQGQLGYTSRAREMKPRYSFSWDWCVRVVPIGAAGALRLEARTGAPLARPRVEAWATADLRQGIVALSCEGEAEFSAELHEGEALVASGRVASGAGGASLRLEFSEPRLWWPNGEGEQPLYRLTIVAARAGTEGERWEIAVGFKHVVWRACAGAPADALPWLCVVNGRPIFLQGVNWTPVRMCYQDVTREETERLVSVYRALCCNLLRVWGGGYLESAEFYAACDRAGLLVWQEFPLSSSGLDSNPPEDDAFVAQLTATARHYLHARQHHASLLQWCGGNELQVEVPHGDGMRRDPLTLRHRALAALDALVRAEDPTHRFLPTSPYGPRFHSTREEFGQGLHHEVHGPWGLDGFPGEGDWERYWTDDDALFRGEIGVAGASRAELIWRYSGGEATWPPDAPYWRHASGWWTQWDRLRAKFADAKPATALAEFTEFTRREQAEKLAFAARAKKAQFPRCGGFLVWMGHDAFPCLANTSIVEFDHALKPAAHALAAVYHQPVRHSP